MRSNSQSLIALRKLPRADQQSCVVERKIVSRHHIREPCQPRARFHGFQISTAPRRTDQQRYAKMAPPMPEEPRAGLIVGGRYELVELAGRGGMAGVWRGRVRGDSGFVRDVAIKQMHQHLAAQPQYVSMLVEDARIGSG